MYYLTKTWLTTVEKDLRAQLDSKIAQNREQSNKIRKADPT